jgi:hypothetical protein
VPINACVEKAVSVCVSVCTGGYDCLSVYVHACVALRVCVDVYVSVCVVKVNLGVWHYECVSACTYVCRVPVSM